MNGSTPAESALLLELVRQVPNLVAFLVLVVVFLRAFDRLATRLETAIAGDRSARAEQHDEMRTAIDNVHGRVTQLAVDQAAGAGCKAAPRAG